MKIIVFILGTLLIGNMIATYILWEKNKSLSNDLSGISFDLNRLDIDELAKIQKNKEQSNDCQSGGWWGNSCE